jgi:hypothetical protein
MMLVDVDDGYCVCVIRSIEIFGIIVNLHREKDRELRVSIIVDDVHSNVTRELKKSYGVECSN